MLKFFQQLKSIFSNFYDPNMNRRKEVELFLSNRTTLTDEEWYSQYSNEIGASLEFIQWFRSTCTNVFGYNLSSAIPSDRLIEDLGMYKATWGDVDWDLLEIFEGEYGLTVPETELSSAKTFGELLNTLWIQIDNNHAEQCH